jgi:two-component system, cell cycle sensor histidine kinase and response regulator CckA
VADEAPRTRSDTGQSPLAPTSAWLDVAVLDLMQEGLHVISFDWRYLYVNRAAAIHSSHSKQELLGRTVSECFPGVEQTPLFPALQRCMTERTSQSLENEYSFPDGSKGWFELRIEPVPEGVLVLTIDTTLRRELQARLALTDKMDALSRLAGGVAHDFNNILTVIVHSSEFVARALAPDDPSHTDLREILHVADRGARVIRQLLAFSRRQPRDARPLHVNDALQELLPIMRRLVSDAVTIELDLAPQNPAIRIDHSHLTQVILNLVSNARDAIGTEGKIAISCALVEREPLSGELVRIAIRDNGCGMDASTRTRIFEPFFTTKDPDKGTGLGLAAAHGIVKQNNGEIRVESAPRQGTTMELYFPKVAGDTVARRPRAALTQPSGGTEVILVVDDEPTIRGLCSRALVKLGYTVMQCESPSEALRFVNRYTGPIDLVLSDVTMPEMNGVQLCQKLKAARPELRCVLMSGYVDSDHHPEIDLSQVLAKPFTQSDLARRIREALDTSSQC